MKNADKVLVGFLVTAGLFSVSNAMQYIKQLSDVQKADIHVLASGNAPLSTDDIPRVEANKNFVG